MVTNKDILCISSQDWISPWCVPQQTMSRLAKYNRVIYVEPYVSIFHIMKCPRQWKHYLGRFLSLTGRVTRVQRNFFVYSPPPFFLPFCGFLPSIGKINNQINIFILSLLLKLVLRRMDFGRPILWIYSVGAPTLIDRLNADLVIYDCIDEWSGYATGKSIKAVIKEMDRQLCEKSHLVFVGSLLLLEDKKRYNECTFFVPHAADVELFSKAAHPETSVPPDIGSINKPIIGLIGVMDKRRIDVELLELLAERYAQCSLVFVGPVRQGVEIQDLAGRTNVHFLGNRELKELPGYLKAFDVCIIPYLINDFTRNIYPLKTHEYMASAKPIVTTQIPALQDFAELIYIASDREDFVHKVALALEENSHKKAAQRITVAMENTWENRLEAKSGLIEKKLASSQPQIL